METFKFILILSLIFGLVVVYPIMVIFQKRKEQKRIIQERKQMEEMLSIYEIKDFDYGTDWKKRMAEFRRAKPKIVIDVKARQTGKMEEYRKAFKKGYHGYSGML